MRWASIFLLLTMAVFTAAAQGPTSDTVMPGGAPEGVKDPVFLCPMDPEIRSHNPGSCPRCGMKLVTGIPDPAAFRMEIALKPKAPKPGEKTQVEFTVRDPWKDRPVTRFQTVHEKLFHAFFIGQDLDFFIHDHPVFEDGTFRYDVTFPKPGLYRVAGDFYPDGATPQMIAGTIIVPGKASKATPPVRDYSTKKGENLTVEFSTDPPDPLATQRVRLLLHLSPTDGLEKYLGAWGHLLAASDDLIDLSHQHPFIAEGGPDLQFNVVFARAHTYRVWVQLQRNGVVNTVHFDVPVREP